MENAVHLEGLRYDGAAHGGCQAECLLFWKEARLKGVDGDHPDRDFDQKPSPGPGLTDAVRFSPERDLLHRATRAPKVEGDAEEQYRCQATELLKATKDVKRRERWDPRFYVRDLTSGNLTFRDFVRYGLLVIVNAFTLRWLGRRYPHVCGRADKQTPTAHMNLQPGELVQVRAKSDIIQTLNAGMRNRGLWFDVEMVPYCEAGNFKVLRRVERIVDEKTGRLVRFPNTCVILDGVTAAAI